MGLITWQRLVYIQPEKGFFGSGTGLVSRVLGIFAFPNGEAGGAHGIGPTELDMGPIAQADFLFEGADHGTEILETKHWMYWRRLF